MSSLLPPRTEEQQGTRASAGPCRSKRVPWAGLAVLIASGAYFTLFYHLPLSSPDEGLIAAAAERILRGQVPYRDFFSELGPGPFYLQAAIFKLGGVNVSSVRLTAWLLGVILSGLIFCLSRSLMSTTASFLPPLLFVMTSYQRNYMISQHWWGNLFFLLMVLSLSAYAKQARRNNPARLKLLLALAGGAAGAAVLCMQPMGACAVLAGITWLVVIEGREGGESGCGTLRRGVRQGLYFLLGVGIAVGLMAGYFGARGGLWGWVQDNLVFLFTNYLPYETAPGIYSWTRLTRLVSWLLRERSERALLYVLAHYFFCLVGPAMAFGGAVWQLLRPGRVEPSRSRILSLYLLGGLGCWVSELHCAELNHFSFASPLLFILLLYAGLCAYRQWPWSRWPLRAAAGLALILVALGTRLALARAASLDAPIHCRRGTIYRNPEAAPDLQQWIQTIENAVPPGKETFFFPYDAPLYFLTETRNPTRYDVLLDGFNSPKQIAEALRSLQVRRPKYIFNFGQVERSYVRAYLPDEEPHPLGVPPLEQFLRGPDSLYRLEREVEGLEVWTLKK